MSENRCPLCQATLKARIPEKIIRPTRMKKLMAVEEPGHRDEYICGAVQLVNKEYPAGTMEARCCVVVAHR